VERDYRYRPALFFGLTALVTWVPWYFGIRSGAEATGSLLSLLGLLGPFVVSLALILGSGNAALKRDLKARLLDVRRIRPGDALLAVAMPLLVLALSVAISRLFGEPAGQLRLSAAENLVPMIVLAIVLAPIIEELGWRGYGMDSLRSRFAVLPASLIFGVLWSLWHAPLALLPGTYQRELAEMENPLFLANFFVGVIPAAVLANWFYYRSNRSIPMSMLFHAALNGAAVLLSAGQVAKTIASVIYLLIAVAVVALDRRVFAAGPRNFIAEPAEADPAPGGAHARAERFLVR
jgi:uncharacterized protein